MVKPITIGNRTRWNYSKIDEVMGMPDLIEIQKNSYQWFLNEGIKEVFNDISPIEDFTGNLVLEFIDHKLESTPKYSEDECRERDVTYAVPLKVKVRLINKETGEVKEQEVFMGDFPLMTENGTFIINGAERVIVSQLVRSPGVYFDSQRDKNGKELFSGTVIPNRGAWLEMEMDSNDVLYVRIDRTRKLPITVLLRALGYGTNAQILELMGEDEKILRTFEKDNTENENEALIEIYKRLRPGEPPTVENARALLESLFFDPKRYDLAHVGRYKFNKKLRLRDRIVGKISAEDVENPETGEIVLKKGEKISRKTAELLESLKIKELKVQVADDPEARMRGDSTPKVVKVISNGYSEEPGPEGNRTEKHITVEDIVAAINYFINFPYKVLLIRYTIP